MPLCTRCSATGIVSAIDFEMDIQKIDDPKGARVPAHDER